MHINPHTALGCAEIDNLGLQMSATGSLGAVLVIDDDEIHHEIVGAALEKYKFSRTFHAYDGDEARNIIREWQGQIDLILCDLYMPHFDGIEFLLSFKDLEADIPVLFISGAKLEVLQSAEELAKAHKIKLAGCLRKPLNFHRFHEILSKFQSDS